MPKPSAAPGGVKRIVYKEIFEGDFRKFKAESNDAQTGGGARDLRFRPYAKFDAVFRKLFPHTRIVTRRRGGQKVNATVLVGRFYWKDNAGGVASKEAIFEAPTDARGDEGRLTVVHKYPPLNSVPPTDEGRIVLLMMQRADGTVWPAFVTEKSLRAGEFHESVGNAVLECLDAHRGTNQVARGYIDFETHERFCDGS